MKGEEVWMIIKYLFPMPAPFSTFDTPKVRAELQTWSILRREPKKSIASTSQWMLPPHKEMATTASKDVSDKLIFYSLKRQTGMLNGIQDGRWESRKTCRIAHIALWATMITSRDAGASKKCSTILGTDLRFWSFVFVWCAVLHITVALLWRERAGSGARLDPRISWWWLALAAKNTQKLW